MASPVQAGLRLAPRAAALYLRLAMKKPRDVGKDFDDYARRWSSDAYGMESGWSAGGVTVDPAKSSQVARPGDEWGEIGPLRLTYSRFLERFLPTGDVNVLEIGAGGGRATEVVLDLLGERCVDYHVVDVAGVFAEVLRERIRRPLAIHIVDDVDLSGLPDTHFDLVFAQSSWSHIGLYDQYRYLRDLRRVMRFEAPIFVNGQFMIGMGHDWGWNRFRRRVYQLEHDVAGVYHEFTGVGALVEMLTRLSYRINCVLPHGFIAMRIEANPEAYLAELSSPLEFPFNPDPYDYLGTGRTRTCELPLVAPAD